jgi:putative membrane protein
MNYRHRVLLPILALAGAAVSVAQTPSPSGSADAPPAGTAMRGTMSMSISAQDFVSKAGMDGMTEVQVAQLATKQGQSNDVKQFAQQMITDHGKANAELTALAQRKNLQVPPTLDSEHQNMVQMLSAKSGAAFDAAYAKEMVSAHDKAIALFTRASNSNDTDIAGFAKKTLPTLQMHKQMAQKLAAKTGGQ